MGGNGKRSARVKREEIELGLEADTSSRSNAPSTRDSRRRIPGASSLVSEVTEGELSRGEYDVLAGLPDVPPRPNGGRGSLSTLEPQAFTSNELNELNQARPTAQTFELPNLEINEHPALRMKDSTPETVTSQETAASQEPNTAEETTTSQETNYPQPGMDIGDESQLFRLPKSIESPKGGPTEPRMDIGDASQLFRRTQTTSGISAFQQDIGESFNLEHTQAEGAPAQGVANIGNSETNVPGKRRSYARRGRRLKGILSAQDEAAYQRAKDAYRRAKDGKDKKDKKDKAKDRDSKK